MVDAIRLREELRRMRALIQDDPDNDSNRRQQYEQFSRHLSLPAPLAADRLADWDSARHDARCRVAMRPHRLSAVLICRRARAWPVEPFSLKG